MQQPQGKIRLSFDTTRFGVKLADGAFDAATTVGEIHARVRSKLVKDSGAGGPVTPTYFFLRNGTEAFIPAPHQTLEELLEAYAPSRESRTLSVTIETEVFSG